MKISFKHLISIIIVGAIYCSSFNLLAQDGAALFKSNCTACHKLGMRLVGPDLIGINNSKQEDWLVKFIKSSQAFIKTGDADAVAIFEEFNKMVMPDQAHLSDNEIKAILNYIKEESPAPNTAANGEGKIEKAEIIPIEYTVQDAKEGYKLFSGKKRFNAKGAACISCHNVTNNLMISGGLLAKDLTNVYARMGDAGIAGILGAPPFPSMATAYAGKELDSTEIAHLTAFLKKADSVSLEQEVKSGANIFILGGGGGLILIFIFIGLYWGKRLKNTVKYNIYKRQIKGSDSII